MAENKQPAMSSKKGPIQQYTKIGSAGDNLLTASNNLLAKVKTAREAGGMIQPDEVLQLINDSILPAVQAIQEGIQGGGEPAAPEPGAGMDKPEGVGSDGPPMKDPEAEKKIAKLEEQVAVLTAKELETKTAMLAKTYGELFPIAVRAAKEKEITDSKEDYSLKEAKVTGAVAVIKAAKDSGEFKRNSVFTGTSMTQSRFAKNDGEAIPAYMR